jgi:hypothetical protein
MKRFWILAVSLIATLVLTACTVTITPVDPFPNALPVTAGSDPTSSVDSSSVAGGDSVVYIVTVPSSVGSSDLLFFELDTEALGLIVYNAGGNDIASSSSAEVFVAGDGAVALVDPAAITPSIVCRGSCVILPGTAGTFFAEVVNGGGSSVDFDLFAFGDAIQDEGEPENNLESTAPTLSAAIDQEGAIETLGDIDLYSVETTGTLSFDSASALDLIAEVLFNGNVQDTISPGETAQVFDGDVVRVRENGGNAAAIASASAYDLTVAESDPFPGAEQVSAGTDPNSAADSDSVAGNGSKVYDVTVSGGAASSDLLYLELDTESASLVVYNSAGTAIASSADASGFIAGGSASVLGTAGIDVAVICRGSCVILEASAGSYFVEVNNQTGGTLNFDLYAFGDPFQDDNEPSNDLPATAPTLGTGDEGAIETLGDEDWFIVNTGGLVRFESTSDLDLRATVSKANGDPIASLSPGQATTVLATDRVRVYEIGGDAAGPAGESGYSLAIE